MTSLRRAIVARILLVLVALGAVSAAAAYQAAFHEATQFMDDDLRQVAELVEPRTPMRQTALHEPEGRFERIAWRPDGTLIGKTEGAPAVAAMPAAAGFSTFEAGAATWRGFVVTRGDGTVLLAQRLGARTELARHAALQVALVILAIMPIVWLVVGWTVGRVIRRLRGLGADIAARSVDARDPLPTNDLPAEIRPLVAAMNVLIARQQEALQQQRRFVADSAHELRTPLTALRLQIENVGSADASASPAAAAELRGGIARAGALLDQLLRLARFDAPPDAPPPETVDLAEMLTQCIADAIEIAEAAGVDIGVTRIEPARFRIAPADLRTLLANVIDNAVAHTPRGGSIDCTLVRDEGGAMIEIVDTGDGVAPRDLPLLFDRFFRAPGTDRPGSGLGLAIVKAIADRSRVAIDISNRADRTGCRVRIRFPASPDLTA